LEQGRCEGYAVAALALSLVSYVHLLGAEKALLAIVLAVAAIRGAGSAVSRSRGWLALGIASIYVVTAIVAFVLLREKLGALLKLISELG
jgi:hypothetical protein